MSVLEQVVPAGTWKADRLHSSVGIEVGHTGSTFRAGFTDFDAALVSGPDGDEVIAEGELTIAGNARSVEGRGRLGEPVEVGDGKPHLALELETVIDRTEFGLGWQMELPGGGSVLDDDVKLLVSLELVKEA